MQTCSQAFKAGATPRASRRNPGPVRCQQGLPQAVRDVAKHAALATVAASLVLSLGLPAEAAKKPPSYYEKRNAYEQEMKALVDARGMRPTVNESPKGLSDKQANLKKLDLSDYKKETREDTPGLPTPLPARIN